MRRTRSPASPMFSEDSRSGDEEDTLQRSSTDGVRSAVSPAPVSGNIVESPDPERGMAVLREPDSPHAVCTTSIRSLTAMSTYPRDRLGHSTEPASDVASPRESSQDIFNSRYARTDSHESLVIRDNSRDSVPSENVTEFVTSNRTGNTNSDCDNDTTSGNDRGSDSTGLSQSEKSQSQDHHNHLLHHHHHHHHHQQQLNQQQQQQQLQQQQQQGPTQAQARHTAFSVADILDPGKFTGTVHQRNPVWSPWSDRRPEKRKCAGLDDSLGKFNSLIVEVYYFYILQLRPRYVYVFICIRFT